VFMDDVNDQGAVEAAADLRVELAEAADAPEAGTRHGEPERTPRGGRAKCAATTRSGRPCPSRPVAGEPFCVMHSKSPATQALLQQARKLGGAAPRARLGLDPTMVDGIALDTLESRTALREAVVRALAKGQISSSTAAAIESVVKGAAADIQADQQAQLEQLTQKVQELVDARVVTVRR
jgi:hypothetical protein